MNSIGFDVHKTSVFMVALNDRGKVTHCREYPTTEKNVIKLVTMVPGPRQVMFEEGGMAGWMKMVVEPYADKVVVCDPTQNRLISKADFNDDKGLRGHSSATKVRQSRPNRRSTGSRAAAGAPPKPKRLTTCNNLILLSLMRLHRQRRRACEGLGHGARAGHFSMAASSSSGNISSHLTLSSCIGIPRVPEAGAPVLPGRRSSSQDGAPIAFTSTNVLVRRAAFSGGRCRKIFSTG